MSGTAKDAPRPRPEPRPTPLPFTTEEEWRAAFEAAELAFHRAFVNGHNKAFHGMPRKNYNRMARMVSADIATAVIRSIIPDEGDIADMPGVTVEKIEGTREWGVSS